MASDSTTGDIAAWNVFDELRSAPLRAEIVRRVRESVSISSDEEKVALTATVTLNNQVTQFDLEPLTVSDIYSFGSGARLDFLGTVSTSLSDIRKLKELPIGSAEFDVKAVDIAFTLRSFMKYAMLSPRHAELAYIFEVLTVGENADFDSRKIEGLDKGLALFVGAINFSDEKLDVLSDTLEESGFDLNLPVKFASDLMPTGEHE